MLAAATALLLVFFLGCILWFSHDYGADLRKAAYFGDLSKVQSILKSHPRVVDSYRPHPEAVCALGLALNQHRFDHHRRRILVGLQVNLANGDKAIDCGNPQPPGAGPTRCRL